MATKLSHIPGKVDHMGIVLKSYKDREWAPRNGEALVFGTKGGEIDVEDKGVLAKAIDVLKGALGLGSTEDAEAETQQYFETVNLFDGAAKAYRKALKIEDETEKASAVVAAIDGFIEKLDGVRGTEKAGARHSAADQAKIDAAAQAAGKMKKALASATKAHSALTDSINGLQPATDSGDGEDDSTNDGTDKAAADDKSAGEYGDVEYADTKNKKYPIDTKAHAKAAWSYINQDKNAKEYDSDELAAIKARIKAACKKFGVDISDESDSKAAPAEEQEMTKEEIAALVADTVKAAVAEAVKSTTEAVKAQSQTEIDAAKALADEATQKAADAETARLTAEAAQKAAEAATNANARKSSGSAAEEAPEAAQKARSEALQRTVKATLAGSSSRPI